MKLALTQDEDLKILTVSEAVTAKDTAILGAGISKMCQTKISVLLVDLSPAQVEIAATPGLHQALSQGASSDVLILAISPTLELADATTLAEAKEALSSQMGKMKIRKKTLEKQVARMQNMKDSLERKLHEQDGQGSLQETLGKVSRLQKDIQQLEEWVSQLAPHRNMKPQTKLDKKTEIETLLRSHLAQQGIVP